MSVYKMLCLDIDGTLLNSNHLISSRTREAIHTIKDEIPVILVSARMPAGIYPYQNELGLKEALIAYSGALILDQEKEIIMNKTISLADSNLLYSLSKDKLHLSIYQSNKWYVESEDYWARQEAEITGLKPQIIDFKALFNCWQESNDFFSKKNDSSNILAANKILCMGDSEEILGLSRQLSELKTNVSCYQSKATYLEIMNKTVTKSAAIEILLDRYGIKKSQVIAIGDNYNDLEMIKYAGLGVAMSNAPQEVQQAADLTTSSNDQDGVAEIIEKYFK